MEAQVIIPISDLVVSDTTHPRGGPYPDGSGAYVLLGSDGKALYVGQAWSVRDRISAHAEKPYVSVRVVILRVQRPAEHWMVDALVDLEQELIDTLAPTLNRSPLAISNKAGLREAPDRRVKFLVRTTESILELVKRRAWEGRASANAWIVGAIERRLQDEGLGERCRDCGVGPGFSHAEECVEEARRERERTIDVTPQCKRVAEQPLLPATQRVSGEGQCTKCGCPPNRKRSDCRTICFCHPAA